MGARAIWVGDLVLATELGRGGDGQVFPGAVAVVLVFLEASPTDCRCGVGVVSHVCSYWLMGRFAAIRSKDGVDPRAGA
jgi:hypothetical protein